MTRAGAMGIVLALALSGPATAQSVRLVQSGTGLDRVSAALGQTLSIDAVADLGTTGATGVALHISFPEGPFRVVDVSAASGTQPFTAGALFDGAIVIDNAAVPPQEVPDVFAGSVLLDFGAVVRVGADRARTGSGVVATFQLLCVDEVGDAAIAVDVNPVRQSLVTRPDGTEATFRGAAGMHVRVAGLDLLDIPDVVLLPGQVDSTRIGRLGSYLVNNHAPADSIVWTVAGAEPESLRVEIVGRSQRVRITPHPGFRGRRDLTFTATEPYPVVPGVPPSSATESAIVIVNTPPRFTTHRDTVRLDEDAYTYVVSALDEPNPARALRGRDLDLIVEDPEVSPDRQQTAFTYGTATFRAGTDTLRQARGRVDPVTHELLTWSRPEFSGVDSFRVIVGDEFTLNRIGQDTLRVIVLVAEVPDAPRFLGNDEIVMQVDAQHALAVADYVADRDTPLDSLRLTWTPDFGGRFSVSRDGDSLRFAAPPLPSEGLFVFTVEDPEGLTDRISQRIRATALPPDSSVTPGEPDFRIEPPFPDVSLDLGAVVDAVAIDDHVVTLLGLTKEQITWSLRTLDDELHALGSIRGDRLLRLRGLAAGADTVVLRGRGPLGRVREDTLVVTVVDRTPEARQLRLLPMPDVQFVAGTAITAFDLDDFVADSVTHPDSLVSWQSRFVSTASMLVQVRGDRSVYVSAADSAVGTVVFEAENLLLRVSGRDTVHFTARPASLGRIPLQLPDLTLAPGATDSLRLDSYLPALDATDTNWTVSGQRLTLPVIGAAPPHVLRVRAPADRVGTDTLSVRVDLGRGFGARGTTRVRIAEVVSPGDFRLVLLPDPVAPDYVAVYVVSTRAVGGTPVVTRTLAGQPAAAVPLAVTVGDLARQGVLVWSATTRIPRPLSGRATLSGTAFTERGTSMAAAAAIVYGSARAGQPLVLQLDGVAVTVPPGAVEAGTFLVLAAGDPGGGASGWQVPAPPPELGLLTSLRLFPAGLALARPARVQVGPGPATAALYRLGGGGWSFVGAGPAAEIGALGTYAVLLDTVPPVLEEPVWTAGGRLVAAARDLGSGVAPATASLTVDGRAVAVAFEGDGRLAWDAAGLPPGAATGRLRVADRAGNVAERTVAWAVPALRLRTELGAAYPNPFNPATQIPFALPRPVDDVRLDVFDVAGQHVRRLASGPLAAGRHVVTWDGHDARGAPAGSGVYLLRLQADDGARVTRVVLLR